MKVIIGNNFGAEKPLEKRYLPDQVEINNNIREVPHGEGNYFLADTTYYTYEEFVTIQDSTIESQKAINQEQDELIAEIIEGM